MARHIFEAGSHGTVAIEYRWHVGPFVGPLTPMWLDRPQVADRCEVPARFERLSDWLRMWAVGMFEVTRA